MKALSLIEKAGLAIFSGIKSLETRRWEPGTLPLMDLAIVQNGRRLTEENPVDTDGQVVAVVDVRRVRPWRKEDAEEEIPEWEEGWLAWELENIRAVLNGPKVQAKLRIYEIDVALGDLCIVAKWAPPGARL